MLVQKVISVFFKKKPFESEGASSPEFDKRWMLPPWKKYSDIPLGSLGWRMGAGEDYWYKFVAWYGTQDSKTRKEYKEIYPKPDDWDNFWPYDPEKLKKYLSP